jgi:hypothetical protein
VHCSRVFRSSVPSSILPLTHGPGGRRAFNAVGHAGGGARPEYGGSVPAGEGSFAAVIMTGFLTPAQAALTALGPIRRNSGVHNF